MKKTTKSTNFPIIWDEQQRSLVLGISQGLPGGQNILTPINAVRGEVLPLNSNILEISFIPTLGGSYSTFSTNPYAQPLMQGLVNMMAQISGSNYTSSMFDYSSLGLHIVLCASYWMRFTRIYRAIRYALALDNINQAVGRELIQALGFSYDSLRLANVLDLRSALITTVSSLNKLMLPVGIPLVDKWLSYVTSVYTDDYHDKSQLYFLDPEWVYGLVNASDSISTSLSKVNLAYSNVDALTALTQLCDEVNSYILSADFSTNIAPKFYRAFLDPTGPKIGQLYHMDEHELDQLLSSGRFNDCAEFVYDESMRDFLRNADFVYIRTDARSCNGNSTHTLKYTPMIWIDSNGILQEGKWESFINGSSAVVSGGIPLASKSNFGYNDPVATYSSVLNYYPTGDRIINVADYPCRDIDIEYAISGLVRLERINAFKGTNVTEYVAIVQQSDPILLISYTYYYLSTATPDVYSSTTVEGLTSASSTSSLTIDNYPLALLQFATNFKIYNRATADNAVQVSWTDIDNIIVVPDAALKQMFMQKAYFTFKPNWLHGSDAPKSFKHRGSKFKNSSKESKTDSTKSSSDKLKE